MYSASFDLSAGVGLHLNSSFMFFFKKRGNWYVLVSCEKNNKDKAPAERYFYVADLNASQQHSFRCELTLGNAKLKLQHSTFLDQIVFHGKPCLITP